MYAVQPTAWRTFDEYGADYTPTLQGAQTIAKQWKAYHGDDCTIWQVGRQSAFPLMRANVDTVDQIADMLFGC